MRWKIAYWLEQYVRACWMDLVFWAAFPENHPFMDIFEIIKLHPQRCIDDAACAMGSCYCGKYRNMEKPMWSEISIQQAAEKISDALKEGE